jgi:uncharacterized protein YxjI
MQLLIKQRVFSWTDTYDVYDEQGNPKYLVKNEIFSLFHKIHVRDIEGNEIGIIRQRFSLFMPLFEIEIGGQAYGTIQKQFTLLRPKYNIDYNGWQCNGDFWAWNYDVYAGSRAVAHISKELFHWGDTYVIDIVNPEDEIVALMLAIAIDAANCEKGKR